MCPVGPYRGVAPVSGHLLNCTPKVGQKSKTMPRPKSSIEQRYNAVIEAKQGVPIHQLEKRYSIGHHTLRRLIARYDKDGISGLSEKKASAYPESYKLGVLQEYETKGLSLREICCKYDITTATFARWLKEYESYKQGDKFALNGNGAVRKCDMTYIGQSTTKRNLQSKAMSESKEKQERRKALSKLSKKDLQELLLDREAELDILKNLEALVRERENKRHEILRKLSKD